MSAEDGQALLAAAVAMFTVVVLMAVGVHVGAVLAARSTASTAADHAALAAATALADGGSLEPAAAAGRVVAAMGARMVDCTCDAVPVDVVAEVDVASPLRRLPLSITRVRATGRAGLVAEPRAVGPASVGSGARKPALGPGAGAASTGVLRGA